MFLTLFSTVSLMIVYLLFGFSLCKFKKATVSHAKSMSALLLYVLNPAMIINAFLQVEYTPEVFVKLSKHFFVTLFVQAVFFLVLYIFLSRKYEDAKYRIMTVGAVLGNVGFIGMPIVSGIFPNDPIVLCYSSVNVVSMNIIVFTIGVFLITGEKKYMSVKSALLNPTTLALIAALPLFIFKVQFPETMLSSIGLLAKMVTPMCMIILGMRLSEANLRVIFTRGFVYATCVLKLIVFPAFALLLVKYLPFIDDISKATVVALAATPSGVVIETLAELHECEQELAANVVLLTTILSVITVPVTVSVLI